LPNKDENAQAQDDKDTVEQFRELIEQTLEDGKAEQISVIDLQGKSSMSDYMVIASGRSNRHVSSLADQLQKAFREVGVKGVITEGQSQADWVLMDTGDIIIHLFRPEVREFYNLEKIWSLPSSEPNLVAV